MVNEAVEGDATSQPESQAAPARQRLLLVTGMLGAGKTTALRVLEDLGWEIVDNFPIRMLEAMIDIAPDGPGADRPPLAIGFDSRAWANGARSNLPPCSWTARATNWSVATTRPVDATSWRETRRFPPVSAPSASFSHLSAAGPTSLSIRQSTPRTIFNA
jgi:hypothetical protein